MIEFRKLVHSDYDDIIDISKGVWEGTDYLPKVFHKWVDDTGYFLGAVDISKNKVIAVGKYSILYDKSGWLEGLRVHKDYRGLKIARELSVKLIDIAKEDLMQKKINKIAFGTYINNKESISLMSKLNFHKEDQRYLLTKSYDTIANKFSLADFKVSPWNLTYEEFENLSYVKKRRNLIDLAFIFQEPTMELYTELKNSNGLITINGYNGFFKLKGEAYFAVMDDSYEAINTFMNYFLLRFKGTGIPEPLTTLTRNDTSVLEKLRYENFVSWSDWKLDYFYYVFRL